MYAMLSVILPSKKILLRADIVIMFELLTDKSDKIGKCLIGLMIIVFV